MKKRVISLILSICLILCLLPVSALDAKEGSDIPAYTPQVIQILADSIDVSEGAEAGVFSFAAQAYAVRRSGSSFSFPILRGGPCAGEMEVVLNVADISATYGTDYVLEIDGNTLDAQEYIMQLVPTEDKNDPASILLTEKHLSDIEHETGEDVAGSTVQDDLERANTVKTPLQSMKEELFGRELSQTDRFYGDSLSETAFSVEDMAQTFAQVLPSEMDNLLSVQTVLRFAAGEQYKLITVRLLPDGTSAGDESFHLSLSTVTEGTLLGEYPSAAIVLKHEGKLEQSVIGFSETNISTQNGIAEVTVTRKKGEYNAALVSFTTVAGSLEPGKDYSPVTETLLFMPGETEKTVSIPVNTVRDGAFSCLLSAPQGAVLANEKTTVTVETAEGMAVRSSTDPLKETRSFRDFSKYASKNSKQFLAYDVSGEYYNIQNTERDHYNDRGNYGIAKLSDHISGAAYSKVTLHYDSHAEFEHSWDAGWYNWNDREASTVFTALWRDGHCPHDLDTGWNWNPQSKALDNKDGWFSGWQHTGDLPRWSPNHTQSIDIPNDCTDMLTYTVQHQHIYPWLARGSVHIKSVELTRRLLHFQFLHHDMFNRRIGSLTNIEKVDNIFELAPTAGRGENTTYVIGDTVGYGVKGAAQDPLYNYMAALGRSGVRDSISANATGSSALTLNGNSGFKLDENFFVDYGKAFARYGHDSTDKVAYIKPAYNKEKWKASLTLEQTPDGTAQLGFIDGRNNIASLSQYPAYLSEEVTLRVTPKAGLYVKGYRVEYKDYDNVTRCSTVELKERELNGCQGRTRDFLVPVRYSSMNITPIYTSLPARKITVTVDPAARQYGVSFPEGVQEALLDAQGNRVGQLEMGTQITEFATAKTGYVPVWSRNGVRYSGESYDFEIGAEDTDVQIGLSFEKERAVTHSITGTLREPKVTINNLLATNFGVDAPKVPLPGAVAATGLISGESRSDGTFTLNNVRSIAGTRRTVRFLRGGECFIYEVDIPVSGSVFMGTVDLSLAADLPYKVSGTISYTKTDSRGNLNTYESNFGGIGQENSNLFRYNAAAKDVNGSIHWIGGGNTVYTECELIFSNKEGVETTRISVQRDVTGNFMFHFDPVLDARAGGGVYLSLTDKNGNVCGPYDTGIVVSDPPSGDIELMEGPSLEIPTKDIELPIVKMTKPNFSSGLFQGNFDNTGLTIVVGFDVKKIVDEAKKQEKKGSNKEAADSIADKAKKEDEKSSDPKSQKVTGNATADIESVSFAATMSFAWFDEDGNALPQQEPGSILALYNVLFYVGASCKAKGEVNASIYGVPVYLEITGKASVAIIVSLSAEDAAGKKTHFPLTAFLDSPTSLPAEGLAPVSLGLGLEAGVGKKKLAALYIDGDMTMDFKWHLWDTGTGTVTFSAGGGLCVLGQKIGFSYAFDPIEMFDTTTVHGPLVYNGQEPVKVGIDAVQTPHFDFDFSRIAMETSQARKATLLEGVLHDTHSRIADIGNGKTMLVFLADVPGRNGVNRTGLYYSIFDGTTAAAPVLIDDDGTLDASPDVMDLGSKVLIVWSDAQLDNFGETADVRDIMASIDISGVFYDKASGKLGKEFSITADSQGTSDMFYLIADTQPTICYDEETGSVGVYYIKEDFGLLTVGHNETVSDFMNGQTTAAFCPIDIEKEAISRDYLPEEEVPQRFQAALNGQRLLDVGISTLDSGLSDPKIESFSVGAVDGYIVFAYPMDMDQSGETTDDQMLFAVLIDQTSGRRYAPIRLTDKSAAINSLRFVKRQVEGETVRLDRLVWQSDGNILCCDMEGLMSCVHFGDDGSCTLSEDFTVAAYADQSEDSLTNRNETLFAAAPDGGVYTVTTRQNGKNSEIFVQYCPSKYTKETSNGEQGTITYLAGSGQWSEAVQVTKAADENARRHILLKDAVAADDGSLLILCDSFEGASDTGDLQLLRVTPSPALKPEISVAADKDYPRTGDTVLLTATVESAGLLDSENVTVEFLLVDKRGISTAIGSWTGDIPAGSSAQAVVEWTVQEELTKDCKIVVYAAQATGELTDLTGEAVALEDISYRYLSDVQGQSRLALSAAILNSGNKTPQELTLQICSVNQGAFHAGSSDGSNAGDAYTVLSATKITAPFENGDYLSQEYPITLSPSTDGMPRELVVRVLTKDGELYNHAVEYISVIPPVSS